MTREQTTLLTEAAELLRTASRRAYRAGLLNPHPTVQTSVRLGIVCGAAETLAEELAAILKDDEADK